MTEAYRQTLRARHLLLDALRLPETLPGLGAADWELLLRVARRVRLLGRLESDLSRLGLLDGIPPDAAKHLRAARNVISHRNTLVSWEVKRIVWALKDCDLPLVLLKGAAYVLADLPPAAGRLFADVDLLVPEERIADIETRLCAKGWFKLPIERYDDRYYRVWMHEIPPLRHRERGTEIDIHHRILPRSSRLQPDPAKLLQAATPLADPRLQTLAPVDMVLHALVHLFLEGDPDEGLRLRDLLDVHDLLVHFGRQPDFWEALVPRARQLDLARPLFYGLRFARLLFASPIPEPVQTQAAGASPSRAVLALMDALVPLAMLPEHPDHPRLKVALARWLLYIRAHWLRMPPLLLLRHLSYKAYLRLRGMGKPLDLAHLDLRQQ